MSNLPVVPPPEHPTWKAVVSGSKTVTLESLSARVLLTSIRRRARDMTASDEHVREFHALFAKSAHFPAIQKDLKKIFG